MKRKTDSSRTAKFIQRNSLNYSNVREYVENLCDNVFEIKKYEFREYVDDEIAIFIYENSLYIIYLDLMYIELKLIKENSKNNNKMIKIFTGDTCWYQSLKFVEKDKKIS